MVKHKLHITNLADRDLYNIYVEGFTTWGEAQADRYYDGLLNRFERICENPMMSPAVDNIRTGYRRNVYERHSIYFVIHGDTVEIRAVVKRQDITARL